MVTGFLKNLSRGSQGSYQVSRLVNSKWREDTQGKGLHVICDIDKTYLETEFENPLSLARIAFENALDKVTVAGATVVLQLARWGDVVQGMRLGSRETLLSPVSELPETLSLGGGAFSQGEPSLLDTWPRPLHFVSSSPPQLRAVLEEKLALDGIHWTSDTFKDQVYNLRMGRMDQLRQHVAYKSLAILTTIERADPGSEFILIGDNAESDIYIYLGVKLFLSGRLSVRGYLSYMERAGVESQVIGDLQEYLLGTKALVNLKPGEKKHVRQIYIRQVPGYPVILEPPLTNSIWFFESFYQVALSLALEEIVGCESIGPLLRCFHNTFGVELEHLAGQSQTVLNLWEPGSPSQQRRLTEVKNELARVFQRFGGGLFIHSHTASDSRKKGFDQDPTSTSLGREGPAAPTDRGDGEDLTEAKILAAAGQWIQKIQTRKHTRT